MMKRSTLLFICIAVSLFMASRALAVPIPYGCANGFKGAWFENVYDSFGNEVSRHGVMCDGTAYTQRPGFVAHGPVNPLGIVSEYFEVTASGMGWCRFNTDGQGTILQMWGQTSDGLYFQVMDWVPDGGGVE